MTVRLRVTDDAGATGHRLGADRRRQRSAVHADDRLARRRPRDGASARRSTSAAAPPTRNRGRCRPSALDWALIIDHCPSNCHQHAVQTLRRTWPRAASSRPTTSIPSTLDPERSRQPTPRGDRRARRSSSSRERSSSPWRPTPPGSSVAMNAASGAAPLTRTVIEGVARTRSARRSPQQLGGDHLRLARRGPTARRRTHTMTRPTRPPRYSATVHSRSACRARAHQACDAPPTRQLELPDG